MLFSTSVKLDPTEGNKFNSSFVQKCHTKYSDNFYSIMAHRTYKTKSHDERNIFDYSTVNCLHQIKCDRRRDFGVRTDILDIEARLRQVMQIGLCA